jgi:hypothetical protein
VSSTERLESKGLTDVCADLTREGAEAMLRKQGLVDGHYVIRTSASHPGSYAMCVVHELSIKHYPVERLTQYGACMSVCIDMIVRVQVPV